MSLAPEKNLKACLAVLYHAEIQGRLLGWEGEGTGLSRERCTQLANLMDAVHNTLADLIQRWEECDEVLLEPCSATTTRSGIRPARLLGVYDRVVGGAG